MTKIYISADLEGALWVTSPRQCDAKADTVAYAEAVERLALEVNTVAEACFSHGATEVVVNDSHLTMANLTLSHLDERISLVSGKPKICAMSAGLDKHFEGAIYVGYHAKAGSENGILNHTFHSHLWDVTVNGVSLGEGGINALYAALQHQVPLILASGDQVFCEEIRGLIPSVSTVKTKTSLSTTAAQSRPEAEVLEAYQGAIAALFKNKATWKKNAQGLMDDKRFKAPYQLEMTFISSTDADCVAMMPWLTRKDGRTMTYTAKDFQELYQVLQSSYAILSYAGFLSE